MIKEATMGYLDPITGQETGAFVTYVIELGVNLRRKKYLEDILFLFVYLGHED